MPRTKKHPMHMTDEEALKHLFHKDIVKAVRHHLKDNSESRPKLHKKRSKEVKKKH